MNPKPLASLNHFTVPYCIALLTSCGCDVRAPVRGRPAHGAEYAKQVPADAIARPAPGRLDQPASMAASTRETPAVAAATLASTSSSVITSSGSGPVPAAQLATMPRHA